MSELSIIDINNVNYGFKDKVARSLYQTLNGVVEQEQATRIATCVVSGNYNSQDKTIELLNADDEVVGTIDATLFIKDGMVSDVSVVNGNLVITFNTDSGKSPISIPLTSIFNPSNYYQKSEIDSKLEEKQSEISNLESKIGYYECSSEASSASKTIAASNYVLGNGGSMKVKMTNANTVDNATLNINSTGAKPLYYSGVRASSTNSWQAGETVDIYYDGTNYYANNAEGVSRQVINEINTKIDALSSGVRVSLAISPSTIYKGIDQSVTLTGTMTNGTPTSMKLMDGNTQLKATTTSPITHQLTANILTNTKSYQVIGETLGLTLNASASMNARYPIYYGFGSNASSVATNANRYSATTSAAHTYEKTSSTNGQSFYILIPTDITDVNNFVMNGAPFVMDAVSTQTINGVSYKVHKSSNTYNSGTTIKVTAS